MSATTLMKAARSQSRDARAQRNSGERWVGALSLAAFTLSTWMLLTLAGGTWMFFERHRNPHAEIAAGAEEFGTPFSSSYVFLALFAGILLLPTLLGLLTQAARTNLGGREEQLAALRLIGATARQVRGMMTLDALRQAAVGLVLGTALYLATVPGWSLLTLQKKRIGTWEMFTWWLVPAVWLLVLVLAAGSVWLALRRVAITPLGVARKVPPKGQSVVVLVLSVIAAIALYRVLSRLTITPGSDALEFAMVLMIVGFILVINGVIAVGMIQLISRLSYGMPGAANYAATRRVGRGVRTTWKRVTALFFVSLIAGVGSWAASVPVLEVDPATAMMTTDISTGLAITAVFGAVLLAASTLLTQSLSVVEQKQLTQALYFIGAPTSFHTRTAVREVGVPMLLAMVMGFCMGALMGSIVVVVYADVGKHLALFAALILLAFIGCVAAVAATGPLRTKVLAETGRLND